MAFLISQKDSGYVENVRCPRRTLWCVSSFLVIEGSQQHYSPVFSAQMRVARLSKLCMANGFTCYVQSGFPRRVSRMRSSWSPLPELNVYQSSGGSWSVRICISSSSHPHFRVPRNARFATFEKGRASSAARTPVSWHITLPVHARRNF
jgi:hypothetical protein